MRELGVELSHQLLCAILTRTHCQQRHDPYDNSKLHSPANHGALLLHAGAHGFGSEELKPHLLNSSRTTVLLFHRKGCTPARIDQQQRIVFCALVWVRSTPRAEWVRTRVSPEAGSIPSKDVVILLRPSQVMIISYPGKRYCGASGKRAEYAAR